MILGPVFRAELLRVARRRRTYTARAAFGLMLLMILWWAYVDIANRLVADGETLSVGQMARFGERIFEVFVVAQLAAVLLVVPATVAGVIADEKQRKTLHYLMATPLSGAEILVDKLLSRLVGLTMLVLVGAPLMFGLTLLGGVSAEIIGAAYLATASSALFLASVAIGVSACARRVREAVLITYLFEIMWIFVPLLIAFGMPENFPVLFRWVGPINEWLAPTDPLFWSIIQGRRGSALLGRWFARATNEEIIVWGCCLQVVYGAIVVGAASLLLRPAFRSQVGGSARLSWFKPRQRPRWRLMARPPVGADPMGWKEAWFTRPDVFTKMIVLPMAAAGTAVFLIGSGIDETFADAWRELRSSGYSMTWTRARSELNSHLRYMSIYYVAVWLLAVVGTAASTVGGERDGDTWTSLVASPLSGREILGGNRRGAIWGLRGFGVLLSLIWLVGLATGAVHPLGLLAAVAQVVAATWFAAALGVYCSLTARTTARGLGRAVLILGGINVVPYLIARVVNPWEPVATTGLCVPLMESSALLSYADVHWSLGDEGSKFLRTTWPRGPWWLILGGVAGPLAYTLGAIGVVWAGDRRFDRIVDRPRRPPAEPAPRHAPGPMAAVAAA